MNPLTTISDRALKILVIMLLAGQPVSVEYIRAKYHQPMGPKSLKGALAELETEQLAARTAYRGDCYIATPAARQMILGEPSTTPSTENGELSTTNGEMATAEVSNLYRRGFDHLVSSSSRYTSESKEPLLLLDPRTSTVEVSSDLYNVHAVLAEYGIGEPALSKLAALPHVTADYVDAHCSRVLADGKDIALAIHRMSRNPPWAAGKPAEAHLSPAGRERARTKYLNWNK
jgi:hypothetical protein